MKISSLLLTALISIFLACSGTTSESNAPAAAKEKQKDKKSCLAGYAMEPCGLLSADQIAQELKIDSKSIETESPPDVNGGLKAFKSPLVRYCSFTWPSDRKQVISIGSVSREIDVDNRIQVGGFKLLDEENIKTTYSEYFDRYYNAMTDEEFEDFQNKVDEKLEEEGGSEAERNAAQKLTNLIPKSVFRKAKGIGDAAVLESNDQNAEARISVLHGNVVFTIVSNVSDSWDTNIDLAKSLAKLILQKC